MNAVLLALLLALAPPTDARASASPAAHDIHISYGAAALEGNVLAVRIRFFKDDLEEALGGHTGKSGYLMRATPEVDADFLAYLGSHFAVEVGGRALEATLVGSGEDELDREPVWWYAFRYEAPAVLSDFRVTNTLLHERFDDQTNIVKFVRFPDQTQRTYSFGRGDESFRVRFGG